MVISDKSGINISETIRNILSPDVSGESSQSGTQFQGRPSEVWSQWQNQHHSQPTGEQHTHPNPSQTEVFQVTADIRSMSVSPSAAGHWENVCLCVCRTCCPYLEIQPREQPTTILRTLLTLGCFLPSLSNVHISPFLSELK